MQATRLMFPTWSFEAYHAPHLVHVSNFKPWGLWCNLCYKCSILEKQISSDKCMLCFYPVFKPKRLMCCCMHGCTCMLGNTVHAELFVQHLEVDQICECFVHHALHHHQISLCAKWCWELDCSSLEFRVAVMATWLVLWTRHVVKLFQHRHVSSCGPYTWGMRTDLVVLHIFQKPLPCRAGSEMQTMRSTGRLNWAMDALECN